MATEKVNVDFTENGVNQIAKVAHESNQSLENIGIVPSSFHIQCRVV